MEVEHNEDDTKTINSDDSTLLLESSDSSIQEPIDVNESCSISFMIVLSLPRIAIAVAWGAQWAALGPLLEILLPSSTVQLIQLVGPLSGLLVAPSIGVLSDNCTSRYGRRKPFLAIGTVLSIISWLMLMHAADLGQFLGDSSDDRSFMASITVACYISMDITVNIAQVPVGLILADFAGDRQVTASTVGGLCSAVGFLLVASYIFLFGPAHNSLKPFLAMLILVMFVTGGVVCCFVKEVPQENVIKKISWLKQLQQAFGAVYTGIRTLPPLLSSYFVILALTQYGFASYNGTKGQFFGLVVMHGEALGADTCGTNCSQAQKSFNDGVQLAGSTDALGIFGLIVLGLLPKLVNRFGMQRVVTKALIPQIFLVLMAVYSENIVLDLLVVLGCGVTQCAIYSLAMPLIIHIVGHGESNQLGLFSGALNSAVCLGQLLNFVAASVLVQTKFGYAAPVFLGGLASFLAFIVAITKLRVNMFSM
ncbi:Glycoside-Pentoside-Hexuronide (GPH):Cation Symporter Family [Thraustotheca clavata]|uniref:Glycoside-Pentoside-Hexuronide (GPH):Cation Symporter Family n=1 Tax=Thraustotheca clavata TaxID=74557 RepID=A0A1W0A5D3_9STRA|nr:Glycoside-Pentoside-Hexuronide (GPH):Cation Symporter Family [Thraustotheca clavata]